MRSMKHLIKRNNNSVTIISIGNNCYITFSVKLRHSVSAQFRFDPECGRCLIKILKLIMMTIIIEKQSATYRRPKIQTADQTTNQTATQNCRPTEASDNKRQLATTGANRR